MLVCFHLGLFFQVKLVDWKKGFFCHFKMEKIALILIYNIFVTKQKLFDLHVSCIPGQMTANQHILKSGLNWITQDNLSCIYPIYLPFSSDCFLLVMHTKWVYEIPDTFWVLPSYNIYKQYHSSFLFSKITIQLIKSNEISLKH